jgi:hypothetical protein
MLCECSDESCEQLFLIRIDEYRQVRREGDFLTAPGHSDDRANAQPGGQAVRQRPSSEHDCPS